MDNIAPSFVFDTQRCRALRDRRSSSGITGRPFAVSLSKEERTADAEPAMASLIDRRNTPLEQRPPRVPQCT